MSSVSFLGSENLSLEQKKAFIDSVGIEKIIHMLWEFGRDFEIEDSNLNELKNYFISIMDEIDSYYSNDENKFNLSREDVKDSYKEKFHKIWSEKRESVNYSSKNEILIACQIVGSTVGLFTGALYYVVSKNNYNISDSWSRTDYFQFILFALSAASFSTALACTVKKRNLNKSQN